MVFALPGQAAQAAALVVLVENWLMRADLLSSSLGVCAGLSWPPQPALGWCWLWHLGSLLLVLYARKERHSQGDGGQRMKTGGVGTMSTPPRPGQAVPGRLHSDLPRSDLQGKLLSAKLGMSSCFCG